MDWNLLREIESNVIFPSDPGTLLSPSFNSAQLPPCNVNQWDSTTSTSFDQFASYNFELPLEDSGFYSWRMPEESYNFVPNSSEELDVKGSKLPNTPHLVNGSGFEGLDKLYVKECVEGVPDCRVLGLDHIDNILMNALSDEDIRAMVNTIEPSQQTVNPCNKATAPFQGISANVLNDPINNAYCQDMMVTTNGMDAFDISFLSDDLPVNSSMMSQGSVASDSSNLINVII